MSGIDLEAILADPPRVHPQALGGVARTDDTCYELIVSTVGSQSVTLETGLGLSTAVFAAVGTEHTAITPDPAEGERLRVWATRTGTSLDRVRLVFAPSEKALPELEIPPVDLFLVDGGHAFPIPQIDWFYGAAHLREGGLLILDDRRLYAVRALEDTLRKDPRWQLVRRTEKWIAFRRLSEGPLAEGLQDQPFRHHSPSIARRLRLTRHRLFQTLPTGLQQRIRAIVQGR